VFFGFKLVYLWSKKNDLHQGLTHAHTFITDPAFAGINENVYPDKNKDMISLL
jgi:hypothetical protein